MSNKISLIFCRCGADVIPFDISDHLASTFRGFDVDVVELNDLCAFSVHEKDQLQAIGDQFDHKIIVACYPRAVKNMLTQSGIDFGSFDVLNFKALTSNEIIDRLVNEYQFEKGDANYQVKTSELKVPAWFPVIDQSRCTLCGQCARFCLFGVYKFDKKSLTVQNPLSCKNQCPACGRTCPASAIMFPRLPEKSALAGDEPTQTKLKVGESNSLFVRLNERNNVRKSIFSQDVMQLANDERKKALEELKASIKKEE